ncbi:MAG: ferritin family protein [Spirochaetes bacterium]|nr:ferritin family protein [Spirochaetota bacterium]
MAYTLKEIIDIAIGIEEAGYDFYVRCGEQFKDLAIKDAFEFLAREEKGHREIFRSMHINPAAPGNFTEEYFSYLRAIGGSRVFGTRENIAGEFTVSIVSPMDALRHAMTAEKDSILFYSEMKGLYLDDREATELLDRILAEERKHVIILAELASQFSQS